MSRVGSPPFPRKRLGQHFLRDPNIIRKIIKVAALTPTDSVFEIGPGTGLLTRALCETGCRVTAVEKDHRLVQYLQGMFEHATNLELHEGDALAFPLHSLPRGTVVVANLPYYISTPLLFKIVESRRIFHRAVVMVQTEVANRLVAKPGSKDYGVLSVLVQHWSVPTKVFTVPPSCFRPSPGVDSTVVRLVLREPLSALVEDENMFVTTVRSAFGHRRKTLSNSLKEAGFLPRQIALALKAAKLHPSSRAEKLSLEDFWNLSRCLRDGVGRPDEKDRQIP